jgi:predicted lipoprotein with Yx(FWY)xxD motif
MSSQFTRTIKGTPAGLAAIALAGLVAACSSAAGAAPAAGSAQQGASGSTISARQIAGVGTVLTDQAGKTLYTPQQEAGGTIKCTGSCLSFWIPVTTAKGAVPHAVKGLSGTLGSVQRPDGGGRQLTYNGGPLYTFRLDTGPGQDHGNNFSDNFGAQVFTWHAATASGTAPAPSQPASPPAGNGGYPGGGY